MLDEAKLTKLGKPVKVEDSHDEEAGRFRVYAFKDFQLILNMMKTKAMVVAHWLKRHARNLGAEVVGESYASEGALLGSANEELKPIVGEYLQVLEKAGREAATDLRLSTETIERLRQPLIPAEAYIQGLKEYLDRMLGDKQ